MDDYEGPRPDLDVQVTVDTGFFSGGPDAITSSTNHALYGEFKPNGVDAYNRYEMFTNGWSFDAAGLVIDYDVSPTSVNNVVNTNSSTQNVPNEMLFTASEGYQQLSEQSRGKGVPLPFVAQFQRFGFGVAGFESMRLGRAITIENGDPLSWMLGNAGINQATMQFFPQQARVKFGRFLSSQIVPDPNNLTFGMRDYLPSITPVGREAYVQSSKFEDLSTFARVLFQEVSAEQLSAIQIVNISGDNTYRKSIDTPLQLADSRGFIGLTVAESLFGTRDNYNLGPDILQIPDPSSGPYGGTGDIRDVIPGASPYLNYKVQSVTPKTVKLSDGTEVVPQADQPHYIVNNQFVPDQLYTSQNVRQQQFGDLPWTFFQQPAQRFGEFGQLVESGGTTAVSNIVLQVPFIRRNFGDYSLVPGFGRFAFLDQPNGPTIRTTDITPNYKNDAFLDLAAIGIKNLGGRVPDQLRDGILDKVDVDFARTLGLDGVSGDLGNRELVPVAVIEAGLRWMSYANPEKYGQFEQITSGDIVNANPGGVIYIDNHPYVVAGENISLPLVLVADLTKPGEASRLLALKSTTGSGTTGIFNQDGGLADFNTDFLGAKGATDRMVEVQEGIRSHVIPWGDEGYASDFYASWFQLGKQNGVIIKDANGYALTRVPIPTDYADADGVLNLDGYKRYVADVRAMLDGLIEVADRAPADTKIVTEWTLPDGKVVKLPGEPGQETIAEVRVIFNKRRETLESLVAPLDLTNSPPKLINLDDIPVEHAYLPGQDTLPKSDPTPNPNPTPNPPPPYGYAYANPGGFGLIYHDGKGGYVFVPTWPA
jgi:hypothetical protein